MSDKIFVTLDLVIHKESDGARPAYLLSRASDGDAPRPQWVPKSLCQRVGEGRYRIERWKAEQCGFLIVRDPDQQRLL